MSLLKKSHLFIFSNFFDFKSIEEKGKDLQTNFFYIEKKFYNCISTSHNNSELKKKIISSQNNTFIFYTGLEQNAKNRIDSFLLNFKNKNNIELTDHLNEIFQNSYEINFISGIKTNLLTKDKGKSKRLLSILFEGKPKVNLKSNSSDKKISTHFANEYTIYIIVPIEYESYK
ncbi:MAG: hypothetical protein K2J02_03950, partial [Malacoplasma sp.]|nr:hypothetical protein [Malacoplasma sp.]